MVLIVEITEPSVLQIRCGPKIIGLVTLKAEVLRAESVWTSLS